MSKLLKKPSAVKREHPALKNMKFLIFSIFVGHFCPPGSGSGSMDLTESGSETLGTSQAFKILLKNHFFNTGSRKSE